MYNPINSRVAYDFISERSGEQNNVDLIIDLSRAIENDELRLEYQPRYDTTTGRTTIFEALVRWQHPDLGLLSPDKFITVAVENGLICKLGLWVFEQCCKDIIMLRRKLKQQINFSVNVSLLQCEDSFHAQKIHGICQKYNLKLSDFEFELTESECIHNKNRVLRFCETLTRLGAEISLDDFGTSYSPLNNLCDLPINTIKIDRSFTSKIGHSGRNEILVNHLIQLAHEMGLKVVAEGVEYVNQLDQLIGMNCDQLQGYYMCKPMPVNNITAVNLNMHAL